MTATSEQRGGERRPGSATADERSALAAKAAAAGVAVADLEQRVATVDGRLRTGVLEAPVRAGGASPTADLVATAERMTKVAASHRRANAALVRMGRLPVTAFDADNPTHARVARLGLVRRGAR